MANENCLLLSNFEHYGQIKMGFKKHLNASHLSRKLWSLVIRFGEVLLFPSHSGIPANLMSPTYFKIQHMNLLWKASVLAFFKKSGHSELQSRGFFSHLYKNVSASFLNLATNFRRKFSFQTRQWTKSTAFL